MIYNVLASGVQQSESVIHIHVAPLFGLFCHLSHYRVLSATQSAECYRECCYTAGPYSYLFYIQWCGYVHPNLPIYPSPISRQEYWNGLPFPLSGESSWDQTHVCWIADRFSTAEPPEKLYKHEFMLNLYIQIALKGLSDLIPTEFACFVSIYFHSILHKSYSFKYLVLFHIYFWNILSSH